MFNRIPILTMKTPRNILIAVSLFFALAASPPASAASPCEGEIRALFKEWNDSLTKDPENEQAPTWVDANYAPGAILIPTLSNEIRRDSEGRKAYFKDFLKKKPSGKIDEPDYVRCFGDIAINSGLYTFKFGDGTTKETQARYTFVYQKIAGKWLIIEHHSSKTLKPCPPCP